MEIGVVKIWVVFFLLEVVLWWKWICMFWMSWYLCYGVLYFYCYIWIIDWYIEFVNFNMLNVWKDVMEYLWMLFDGRVKVVDGVMLCVLRSLVNSKIYKGRCYLVFISFCCIDYFWFIEIFIWYKFMRGVYICLYYCVMLVSYWGGELLNWFKMKFGLWRRVMRIC